MAVLLENAATLRRGSELKTLFVVLVYLDLTLTLLAVGHGFAEVNPIMQQILGRPSALLATKVVLPPVLAWLAPSKLLLPSIVLMTFVVTWNALQLLAAA